MNLDVIFKLIRKGNLILFIGSGFSKYAGYPSGKQLADLIYDNFTEEEKAEVDCNLPLADLTEEFVRINLGNKRRLFEILQCH